jgi:hypothetical protein
LISIFRVKNYCWTLDGIYPDRSVEKR